MYPTKHLLLVLLFSFCASLGQPSYAQAALVINLDHAATNPPSPQMGDWLTFTSDISNTGNEKLKGVVAWISLVEVDPGNEQPVDLEDWSAHKAIAGKTISAGQDLTTNWPMRLIKAGDYRVVISAMLPSEVGIYTSRSIPFHVQQKPVIESSKVLPVAGLLPCAVLGLAVFRKKHKRLLSGKSMNG